MRWVSQTSTNAATTAPDAQSAPALRNAERPLWLLLIVSIVLPLLIFAGVATIAYFRQFDAARDRLLLRLGHVYEHAQKVFETFELSAQYTNEMFSRVSDEQIRAAEREYSTRLRAIIDTLPQLRDIWLIDAAGHPIVSGTVLPMPRDLNVSDRPYFSVHKNNQVKDIYISDVLQARAADTTFFAITRKLATATGEFRGVMTVSIAPEYFTEYYARLPVSELGFTALVRSDGGVLAQHPQRGGYDISKLPNDAPFFKAIASVPQSGMFNTRQPDGVHRIVAYRHLPRHDVYVLAGLQSWGVIRDWLWLLASHLVFGIPATIAMVSLAWVALQRTRRESLAYARLRHETARREDTESALRQAQKMEAVGRLTGGIAHDFNNLLTAILGNVEMAAHRLGNGDERVQRSLSSAREASLRAAALVQRMLAFSRQQPLEVKVIDANRLVQDMSELLRRTLGETIAVETVLGGGLWKSSIDPNQLENAILNLAINARDAMPKGGRLTIETSNAYLDEDYVRLHGEGIAPGQYVLIAITDSGIGMAEEVRERAFDPFFTTKPAGVGTGLGLSMVYGFVRQSSGHVKIYSEPGEGTSIKMYLPRTTQAAAQEEAAPHAAAAPRAEGAEEKREKILLVEDDAELNRFGKEVLQELGYRVVSAHDGPAALKLLPEHPDVKLLFTDVVLPKGMNGRELAREVERQRPDIKVLFTTGYTRNAIVHDGRLDEGVELLTKPFSYDALAGKVRKLLDAAAAESRAGRGPA